VAGSPSGVDVFVRPNENEPSEIILARGSTAAISGKTRRAASTYAEKTRHDFHRRMRRLQPLLAARWSTQVI